MGKTRRAILVGLAGVVAGGCLSREPDPPPRTTVTEQTPPKTDGFDTATPTPTVAGRQISRGPDGDVRIDATIQNDAPSAFEGYLLAELDFQERTVRAQTRFEVEPFSERTVSLTAPIDYEAFNADSTLRLSVRTVSLIDNRVTALQSCGSCRVRSDRDPQ